jgi:hypothetical protein
VTEKVEIECGEGDAAYKVRLTAKSLDVFVKASGEPAVRRKEGEALVAALLAAAQGGISRLERFNKCDQRNDGPQGQPAVQGFNDSGALRFTVRHNYGLFNDGPNGEPAEQWFDDNGGLVYAQRYKDGSLNDGPNGEPARQWFDGGGALIMAERWKNGTLIAELTAREIADYIPPPNRQAAIKTLRTRIPGLNIL